MDKLTWNLVHRLINERGLDINVSMERCLDEDMFKTLKEYHEALTTIKIISSYVKSKALKND